MTLWQMRLRSPSYQFQFHDLPHISRRALVQAESQLCCVWVVDKVKDLDSRFTAHSSKKLASRDLFLFEQHILRCMQV